MVSASDLFNLISPQCFCMTSKASNILTHQFFFIPLLSTFEIIFGVKFVFIYVFRTFIAPIQ